VFIQMLTFFEGEAFSGWQKLEAKKLPFAALAAFSSGHSPSPAPFPSGPPVPARAVSSSANSPQPMRSMEIALPSGITSIEDSALCSKDVIFKINGAIMILVTYTEYYQQPVR
jgi:hypothetical protein